MRPGSPRNVVASAIALAGAAAAMALPLSSAALAATAMGHASVTILPTIAVGETAAMDFGILEVTKAGGSVVLTPDGIRRGPAAFDGAAQPGRFTVIGTPDAAVAISLSAGDAVTGPGPAMRLGAFTHDAGRAPALNSAGRLDLAVGATVRVAAGQPSGRYAGTYMVVVNY